MLARDGVAFKLDSNPVTLIPRQAEFDRARDRVVTDEELRDLWWALEDELHLRATPCGSPSCSAGNA